MTISKFSFVTVFKKSRYREGGGALHERSGDMSGAANEQVQEMSGSMHMIWQGGLWL